jgi:hypothetical protein
VLRVKMHGLCEQNGVCVAVTAGSAGVMQPVRQHHWLAYLHLSACVHGPCTGWLFVDTRSMR